MSGELNLQASDVRIIQLSTAQIAGYYALIAKQLARAFGSDLSKIGVANLMSEAQTGKLQVWAALADTRTNGTLRSQLLGFAATRIWEQPRFDRRVLVIEAAAGVGLTPDAWEKGMSEILRFAKANRCSIIEAEIMNPSVARQAKRMGFEQASVKYRMEV